MKRVQHPGVTAAAVSAIPFAAAVTSGLLWAEARWARRHGVELGAVSPTDGTIDGPGPQRIVWLGDSLAAGLGAGCADATMAHLLPRMLGKGADIRNLAVSGATVADVASSQIPALEALVGTGWVPDVVFLSVGANDVAAMTSRREFAATYDRVLHALADHLTIALCIPDLGMPDRLPQPLRTVAAARARYLDRALRRCASTHEVAVVDVASRPEGMPRKTARSLLSDDRFHPGPAGYELWAERLAVVLNAQMTPAGALGTFDA